jgi:outer membrane murein-binding lipoprotein Lpp
VPRKLTVLLVALAVLGSAAVAGCGGDDKSSQTKGNLGVTLNLKVAQDEADIQEFCNLAPVPKGDLYDRALFGVVAATDDLIIVYKNHSDGVYYDAIKKRETPLKQRVADLARKLNSCGKDGKQQSAKLTQALQSS